MDTRKKGRQFEQYIKKYLEKEGYQVYLVGKKAIYIKRKMVLVGADIFGCDLVAVNKDEKILFIQATCHSSLKTKLDKLAKYSFPFAHCDVQVWQKVDDGRVRIFKYDGNELRMTAELRRSTLWLVNNNKENKENKEGGKKE